MTIMVIDGQGGKMGKGLVEMLKKSCPEDEILAIGTNSIATAAMLKAGADAGATGENPAVVTSRTADIIVGPMGIVIADSLMGEITPAIAVAIGQSRAQKVLLPVNSHCGKIVVGVRELTLSRIMDEAVEVLRELCAPRSTTL